MKYAGFVLLLLIIGGVVWWGKTAPKTTPEPSTEEGAMASTPEKKEETVNTPITTNKKRVQNGMTIETTKEGTGPAITNGQTAVVQYEGKLTDGSIFDSTAKHGGRAFEFPLGAGMVIKGWDQGVLGMKVGETRVLTIPPELGYGADGYPPVIPQNATLTFTVTLEGIK